MIMEDKSAYDQAITIFSPDGRMFQVEYARGAANRGALTLGLKFKNGLAILADQNISSELILPESVEKVFKINNNIACGVSGLVADARKLVDRARHECQWSKILYGEDMDVGNLVKRICDIKRVYTQYSGVRPFGTTLLFGGRDHSGFHLFETDPSGATKGYEAGCLGAKRKEAEDILLNRFKKDLPEGKALKLAYHGRDNREGALAEVHPGNKDNQDRWSPIHT